MDKKSRACCFLCLLFQFHGGAEQAVRTWRVKPDTTAQHLSDNIQTHSFHFIALHALKMQTPRSKFPLLHFFTAHHTSSTLCVNSAAPLESRQISSGRGDTSYCPLTLSSATTALSSDEASVLTRSVRKVLLTWHTGRDPGPKRDIDPLTLQATGREGVELQMKVTMYCQKNWMCFRKRGKKHSSGSHTAKHNQFLMFRARVNELVVKCCTHAECTMRYFVFCVKTQAASDPHTAECKRK